MKALSPGEATAFLEAAKEDPHGLIFAFGLATGMRPEEYLALQWKDIDLLQGTATVQRTLVGDDKRAEGGTLVSLKPRRAGERFRCPLRL
jgi:integrase